MHGKYLMLPTTIKDISTSIEEFSYWQHMLFCLFLAIILFIVYSIVWYIGEKDNDR